MRISKVAAVSAAGVMAVLSLSGCLRSDTEVVFDSSGTVSAISLEVGVEKASFDQFAAMGGSPGLEGFKESFSQETSDDSGFSQQSCEFSESDTEYVARCSATSEAIAEGLSSDALADTGLAVAVEGSNIVVTFTPPAPSSDSESNPLSSAASTPGISSSLTLVFPGPVSEVSAPYAKISPDDPNVAVIDVIAATSSTAPARIVAASSPSSSSSLTPLLILLGGLVVLGVLAVVLVPVLRRRSAAPAPSEVSSEGLSEVPNSAFSVTAAGQPAANYGDVVDGNMFDGTSWRPISIGEVVGDYRWNGSSWEPVTPSS